MIETGNGREKAPEPYCVYIMGRGGKEGGHVDVENMDNIEE